MNFKNQSFSKSLSNALRGIRISIRSERNLKIQVTIMILLMALGFILKFSPMEWGIIALTSAIVISTEMINTAIEITVDMVCQENFNTFAKNAKDVAAGAVLIVSIGSVIVGAIIILPKIINLIK